MASVQQYVTLVVQGGTPVRLANQVGAPYPTTGQGALVFATGGNLNNPTVDGNLTVNGDLVLSGDIIGSASTDSVVNVKDFGAVGDGVTDDTAAIQAALNAGSNEVGIPVGTYRCASGITVPAGVTLRGYNFLPDNPPHGTILMFDVGVMTCVTLDGVSGGGLTASALREIIVSRPGAQGTYPPVGTIGVLIRQGYNVDMEHVMVYNHDIGFKWVSGNVPPPGGGLGSHCSYLFTGAIGDAHMVVDGWPEVYFVNCRFGMNGMGNLHCNTHIRVQGGTAGTAGGPNTLNYTNCQFNQGGGGFPDYLCSFVNKTPGMVDASSFKFTSCHTEGIGVAYFYSDATFDRLNYFWLTGSAFHIPIPLFALNAATQPWNWHIIGCEMRGMTLAPTQPFVETAFVGNAFSDNVSITGAAGSALSFIGNSVNSTITLAGDWASLSVQGGIGSIGTLVNNAKGNISIDIPGVANHQMTRGNFGPREIERFIAYNNTPTNNDGVERATYVTNSAGTLVQAVRHRQWMEDVTAGSEDSVIFWELMKAGTLTPTVAIRPTVLHPLTDNVMSCGTQGAAWNNVNISALGYLGFGSGGTAASILHTSSGSLLVTGNMYFNSGSYGTPITVVGSLGAAAGNAGMHKMVGDATTTTFGTVVVGGGSNVVPVYCDGGNWRIG